MSDAITRKEAYLKSIGNGTSSALKPITREEQYLAYIAGESKSFPTTPITREEAFLDKIAKKGAGGGSSINVQPLNATANGTYDAPEGQAYDPVIVNVKGGIIDVETLPTENIDDNAVYRITETISEAPQVYLSGVGGVYTVEEFLALDGVFGTVTITQVSALPATMTPAILGQQVVLPLYVLESNGIAYISQTGSSADAISFATLIFDAPLDMGWTENVFSETETGVYCVRGKNQTIYHYWKYSGSAWSEFLPTLDVETLPENNIDEDIIYRVVTAASEDPEVYMYVQNRAYTIPDVYKMMGATITVSTTLVTKLPNMMTPTTPNALSLYVLESDGKAYCTETGSSADAITLGAKMSNLLGGELPDYGWAEDIDTVTNVGVYCVRGEEFLTYHYWRYRNNAWADFVAVARVDELPSANISSDMCYHVDDSSSDNADKYFMYENEEFIEYAAGPDFYDFISGNSVGHITLPSRVTSIAPYAFYGKQYSSATLPKSFTNMGSHAFDECNGLKMFYCDVPFSQMSKWTIADDWINNDSVIKFNDAICGATGGLYVLSENGNEYAVATDSPVICKNVFIPSVIGEVPVTSINSSAFYDNDKMVTVNIANGVTSIGGSAFQRCDNLTKVTISDGVMSIGGYAFRKCRRLTSITLPETVTSIGEYAFAECSNLESIIIPNGVTRIEQYLFYSCSNLTDVTIGKGVTEIGINSFAACYKLTDINYLGTMEEWRAISQLTGSGGQTTGIGSKTIHCTDGDIANS